MTTTLHQYNTIVGTCQSLFLDKVRDYGTSWRVLRPLSLTDQLYIKAWRIRQIQEKGKQQVEDSIASEFTGIVNYGIIALIQASLPANTDTALTVEAANAYYEKAATQVRELMLKKNHDYGEAWRDMSQQSFVDMILVKLLRIRQILANDGKTVVSEGINANFADIVNYGIFALIKLEEANQLSPIK